MLRFKTFILIFILCVVALVDIQLYRNTRLLYQARETGSEEEKISVLNKVNRIFPFNHFVFSELGKAYFEIGIRDLTDTEKRDEYFNRSVQSFRRSIQLNPGYYQSHFYFAQALSYVNYFIPMDIDYYDEYKKAARLTTFDTQAYFEVGRFLLTHWPALSKEDQRFTVDLLKNVKMTDENLQHILHIWALNLRDYALMEEVLPQAPGILRAYARFLAEKGLSLEERHKKLAQAEYLEFETAKTAFMAGERDAQSQKLNQALNQFQKSLRILENINFYQNLTDQNLINFIEYQNYKKAVFVNLAKTLIQKSGDLNEAAVYLKQYLDLEENAARLAELEVYLKSKNLLDTELSTFYNDFMSFYLKISIEYRLNRYREIIDESKKFKDSFISPPSSLKKDMSKVCLLIGESYQRGDYLYDAEEYFEISLDLDPENFEALKALRQNFQRLNKLGEIQRVDDRIKGLLTPKRIEFEDLTIAEDGTFRQTLFLEEKKLGLILSFRDIHPGQSPLLTICFNGQLVWEGLIQNQTLSIFVNSIKGENILQLQTLLLPVVLESIESHNDHLPLSQGEQQKTTIDESPRRESSAGIQQSEVKSEKEQDSHPAITMAFINKMNSAPREDSLVIEIWTDPFSSYNTFELSNPNRLIVDIAGIADIKSQRQLSVNDHGISQIRMGMFKSDTARIVISFSGETLRYSVEKKPEKLEITFWK